jgi:hypothetical protein
MSSAHALFVGAEERATFAAAGWLERSDVQFHWRNRGYATFEDYLGSMRSDKRKQLRRERRRVAEEDIHYLTLHGPELTPAQLHFAFEVHQRTFHQHGHPPYLNLAFFEEIAATLGEALMVKLALRGQTPVAAAIFLVSGDTLFGRYEAALSELLRAAEDVSNVEDAWLFFHMLFELIWQYRFLYRDLNDLLSKNRRLETHFQFVLKNKSRAVQQVLDALSMGSTMRIERREAEAAANAMVVVLTYWLSYEYVRDPRKALEPENAAAALARGAYHVLCLLTPYLDAASQEHLHTLAGEYLRS